MAGAAAGFTGQSVVYPLDVARARMAVTKKDKYQNLFQVFRQIIGKEGMFSINKAFKFYQNLFLD